MEWTGRWTEEMGNNHCPLFMWKKQQIRDEPWSGSEGSSDTPWPKTETGPRTKSGFHKSWIRGCTDWNREPFWVGARIDTGRPLVGQTDWDERWVESDIETLNETGSAAQAQTRAAKQLISEPCEEGMKSEARHELELKSMSSAVGKLGWDLKAIDSLEGIYHGNLDLTPTFKVLEMEAERLSFSAYSTNYSGF